MSFSGSYGRGDNIHSVDHIKKDRIPKRFHSWKSDMRRQISRKKHNILQIMTLLERTTRSDVAITVGIGDLKVSAQKEEILVKQARLVILVVEDEPLLRWFAVDMVEEAGFEALQANGSNEAIRILERRLDICLVFTDIDMPDGVDGLKLAAMIRDRWPPIHIFITSGQSPPPISQRPVESLFFPKPYCLEEITTVMRVITQNLNIRRS